MAAVDILGFVAVFALLAQPLLPGGLVSVVRSDVVSVVITLGILPALLVVGVTLSGPLGGLAAALVFVLCGVYT